MKSCWFFFGDLLFLFIPPGGIFVVGFVFFFFLLLFLLFLLFSFRSAGESKLETIEDGDLTWRLWEESNWKLWPVQLTPVQSCSLLQGRHDRLAF